MKKTLLIIFFLFLIEAAFPPPVKAVTCGDILSEGKCGALGGCPVGARCSVNTKNAFYCHANDSYCSLPAVCPNNSVSDCVMLVGGKPLGLPVGTACPTEGFTCQPQGAPFADPNKCVCRDIATPTPTPTPSIIPTPSVPIPSIPIPTISIPPIVKACPDDGTIYPPNSECYAETKRTQTEIDQYPKTCIKEPTASYEDTRYITDQYGYANCFEKDGGDCDIYITVTTDLSKAELGSYGPNYETLITASADSMSKKYLFNALFDRPSFSIPETPRETWRTYWRLLPTNEQFNLVAQFMKMVNLSTLLDFDTLQRINNTKWQYIDKNLDVHETTIKKLSDSLPRCLKTEPVCPDFAQFYNALPDNTKAAYDTILPLSLNNLRGFIALLPPPSVGGDGQVVRESQPYIETIFQGLLSSKYGLIGNLQPSWLFKKSQTGLTDPNTSYDLSAGKGNYISGQFGTINFDDNSLNASVLDKADIIQCSDNPNVYSLSAPRTFPKNTNNTDGSITQDIKILGSTLKWEVKTSDATLKCPVSEVCKYINKIWVCKCPVALDYVCDSPLDNCSESPVNGAHDKCCQYKVTGSGKGKALTVFNNPKTTDIKDSVAGNKESALYDSLIPLSLLTPTPIDKKISAPTASNTLIDTKKTGAGTLTLQGSSIIRENNLAQDTMHLLQNCWLVPSDQQSSVKCGNTTSACGSGELPDLTTNNPTCGICNDSLSNLATLVDDDVSTLFPEGKMPDLMKQIMQKAGEVFGVPASTIFGTMYHEGAFSGNRYQWTEENVKEWSLCGGNMPHCDKNSGVTQPPYGWIPYWFYEGEATYAPWSAVQQIDPSRTKADISPCNFLDATFATAKTLKMWAGVNTSGYATCCQPPGTCYNLNAPAPTSCSGWTLDDVARSNVGYGGYCPEEGKRGIYPPSNFIEQTIVRHQALKCY